MAVAEVTLSVGLGFLSGCACVLTIWYWTGKRGKKKEIEKLR